MLNLSIVFFTITSVICYLIFKRKQFRTSPMLPIRKKMYASLAGVALGSLLIFFGLGQILLYDKIIIYVVSAILVLFGLYVATFNFRAHKHYAQFIEEEAKINEH